MRLGGEEESSPAACQGQRKPADLYKVWWRGMGVKCSQRIQEPGLALSFEGRDMARHIWSNYQKPKIKRKTWKQSEKNGTAYREQFEQSWS